jgi:hypothetical protein
VTRLLVQEKNMCWIFVQNPIQKNLAQYKVLNLTFLLIRRRICICVQVNKTPRNWSKPTKWCAFLFNVKIVYTAKWRLFATPDTPWSSKQLENLFRELPNDYFETLNNKQG